MEKLAKEIRRGVAGNELFADYERPAFAKIAESFAAVGYTSWGKVKTLQKTARDFILADLRRPDNRRTLGDIKLLLGIFDVYERRRKNTNLKDPTYEAATIHDAMKRWMPNMKDLSDHLKPSQDICHQFPLGIAKGELSPPVFPYVVPDLSKKPWAAQEPPHTSSLGTWKKLQKAHKGPGCRALSINQWFLYNHRYILSGDLTGALPPLGV